MSNSLKITALLAVAAAAVPGHAWARDASYYRCENKPVPVTIPALPLGEALAIFTQATRCPVSLDTKQVGRADVKIVPTQRVEGRLTPAAALRRMLSSSPLKSRVIKGGFSIYQN